MTWRKSVPRAVYRIWFELSSIVRIANAIAAWPDIHLRERCRSLVHEDRIRVNQPASKQTIECIGRMNSRAQSRHT